MLVKGRSVPKIYWVLMIPIFLWMVSNRVILNSQWERYGFSEAEDYGHFIFDIVICLLESFIYILFIWLCVSVVKYLFGINRERNK